MNSLGISACLALAVLLCIGVSQPALADKCGTGKSHNAIFGQLKYSDQLLHMEHVKLSSKFLRVVTQDVTCSVPNTQLTYIEVMDQYTNGKGGCATIISGGIGSPAVSLHLKSKRDHGLDFIVKCYGKKTYNW